MQVKLSAIILTYNCEETITDCLNSVKFADEIIIIDSYSTDNTLTLIKEFRKHTKYKVKAFKRQLDTFSRQRNVALKKAKSDWVLFLDSDEEISPQLSEEIIRTLKNNTLNYGFYLKRADIFLGKKLQYGETANVKLLRLAKRSRGRWVGAVHEEWQVKGRKGKLSNPIIHNRKLTVSQFLEKINSYSTLRASELFLQKQKEPFMKIFYFPPGKFFYNYILRLGFLDGFPGFAIAWLMSWHSLLVRVKLRLLWLNNGSPNFIVKD
jgi:glycosyltransferase involved in cell wall biosynthesis